MEQELFSTQEAAKKLGIKPPAFRMKALRAGFEPAKVIQGKGSPQKFWTAEQIATIAGNARAEVTDTERDDATVTPVTAERTGISTVELAPVVDTEALIAEPLDNKSLEQLADEANLYTKRGDDCIKLGLTFYFEAGRRLNEAKKRIGHGNWQNWLAQHFSASDDTANNYMKLARRFGEQKPETFRNLNLATAIKLLALPEGTEEEFIQTQAAAGKPVELQSARELQRNVKAFKQHKADSAPAHDEPQDTRADVSAEETDDREVVSENTPAADTLPAPMDEPDEDTNVVITPAQVAAIRKLIDETDDLHALKTIYDSLLVLGQEIGKIVLLAEMKLSELAQKNKPYE